MQSFDISRKDGVSKIEFQAMASPCEILLRTDDKTVVNNIAQIAIKESSRIEKKYSRYIEGNYLYQMNHSDQKPLSLDHETFKLLEYSKTLFQSSDGMFDITSGVLRKIWNFSKAATPPSKNEVEGIISFIGFEKLQYTQQSFQCPKGMEIDFGGIGKEYAVDQVAQLITPICEPIKLNFMINFGGDISAKQYDTSQSKWIIGVEDDQAGEDTIIKIATGCVATSGNSKRNLKFNGQLYGHILNPKTGFPVENTPMSITTFGETCLLAGSFSSLAMLNGKDAETFLKENELRYVCIWFTD